MTVLSLLFFDYLNPDWDLDGPSSEVPVGQFAEDASDPELHEAIREAIELMQSDAPEADLKQELERRQLVYYSPDSEGHTYRTWPARRERSTYPPSRTCAARGPVGGFDVVRGSLPRTRPQGEPPLSTHLQRSWLRRGLLVAATILGLGAASAAVPVAASAAVATDVQRSADFLMDPTAQAKSNFSGVANVGTYAQDSIVTYAGWQYVAWYSDDNSAQLSRRQLPGGAWKTIELDYDLEAADSHNNISMAVSPSDGRLQIAFGQHGQPHRYTRSVPGLASAPASANWSSASFSRTQAAIPGMPGLDTTMTYPTFETVRGKLLLTWRDGSPSGGSQVLAQYNDNAAGTWTYKGAYSTGEGTYNGSTGRNGYLHGFEANPVTGDLEITWTYREATGGCLSHDLSYARSPDLGMTWYDTTGRLIGRTGTANTINLADNAVVVPIPGNTNLMNSEAMDIDHAGRAHAITSQNPPGLPACANRATYARPFHHWRDAAGAWHSMQIPTSSYGQGRSNLVMGANDTAYVIFPDARILAATAASNWTDWTTVYTPEAGVRNTKETIVDRQRIEADGVISVGYEEPSATAGAPAPFRIADFAPGTGADAARSTQPVAPSIPWGTGASSQKRTFEGYRAFDGSSTTKWVSNGTNPGDGPTATNPQWISREFWKAMTPSSMTIVPGGNYGPKQVRAEVRQGTTWVSAGSFTVPAAGGTFTLTAVKGNAFRLLVTSSYDPTYPTTPRNVQVSELQVVAR